MWVDSRNMYLVENLCLFLFNLKKKMLSIWPPSLLRLWALPRPPKVSTLVEARGWSNLPKRRYWERQGKLNRSASAQRSRLEAWLIFLVFCVFTQKSLVFPQFSSLPILPRVKMWKRQAMDIQHSPLTLLLLVVRTNISKEIKIMSPHAPHACHVWAKLTALSIFLINTR